MQAEAPTEALVTASLRRRFLAYMIDSLVMFPVDVLPILFVAERPYFLLLTMLLINAAYSIVFTTTMGGTPGKLLLGLYVGDSMGRKIGLRRATARHIVKAFPYLKLLLLVFTLIGNSISFFVAVSDVQRRAIHDHIAGTRVLRGKAPTRR